LLKIDQHIVKIQNQEKKEKPKLVQRNKNFKCVQGTDIKSWIF